MKTLEAGGLKLVEEAEILIIELENESGIPNTIIDKLATEHIDIKHIYATMYSKTHPVKVILATSDNQKALLLFQKK